MLIHSRKPLPTHYRDQPIQEIGDRRLRSLASPRSQCSERYRAAFRYEMGRRYVWMMDFTQAIGDQAKGRH